MQILYPVLFLPPILLLKYDDISGLSLSLSLSLSSLSFIFDQSIISIYRVMFKKAFLFAATHLKLTILGKTRWEAAILKFWRAEKTWTGMNDDRKGSVRYRNWNDIPSNTVIWYLASKRRKTIINRFEIIWPIMFPLNLLCD